MTINPIQPNKGNRDDAASRSNAPATPYSTPKQGQGTTGRDEGSRSFRSGGADSSQNQSQGQSQSQSQGRDYDASEVLRCLDTIEENCRTVRKSLSGGSRDGTRQATERSGNAGNLGASRTEDDDASSERNRNFGNAD